MNSFILVFINTFVEVMQALLLVYVVMSYFVPPDNRFRAFVDSIVNLFLDPIRNMMPMIGPFDFSVMVFWFLLVFLQNVARGAL